MTYSHMANATLPSARRGFTSEFGKGSGGSLLLLSPANCLWTFSGLILTVDCISQCVPYFVPNEFNGLDYWVGIVTSSLTKSSLNWSFVWIYLDTTTVWVLYSQASRAISIGQLHISLCFHIQPINVLVLNGSLGKSNLEVGFPLRCFQRLSHPNVATGQCHWHDNPNTSGSSTLVLSY